MRYNSRLLKAGEQAAKHYIFVTNLPGLSILKYTKITRIFMHYINSKHRNNGNESNTSWIEHMLKGLQLLG